MINYHKISENDILDNIFDLNINYLLCTRNLSENTLLKLVKYCSVKHIIKTQTHLSKSFINQLLNHPDLSIEETYL
tara:strand:+ start:116 stop:343 length:228 start_codon:yes stop_codon:yes gene_type:complete